MNPRIGIIAFGLHVGGMEQSMLRMARCFKESGTEVDFVTTEEKGSWYQYIEEKGFQVRHIGFHPLGGFFHALRVGALLAKSRYDVVILFHAKYAQASLAMLSNKTIVIPTIRLDDFEFYRIGLSNSKAWNVALTNSPRLQAEVQRRKPAKPVICIPNGVEIPSSELLGGRRRFGGKLQIVFVGRLAGHKGVNLLPAILAECSRKGLDFVCRIAGDGEERDVLQQKLHDMGMLGNKIIMMGAILHTTVYDLLLDSHILILPTLAEGLPNVLLEAQACGCVPVASHIEGITDVAVVDGTTGFLISSGSSVGFADAIERLAKDEALWVKMSSAGSKRITELFSTEQLAEAYNTLLADCASGKYSLSRSRHCNFPVDLRVLNWRDLVPPFIKIAVRPIRRWFGRSAPNNMQA